MQYLSLSFFVPVKTMQRLDKMAEEYGFSRANMALHLIQNGLMEHGEPIEISTINPDGERRKDGIAVSIHNAARKLL